LLGTNLQVWCDGVARRRSVAGLTFVAWQQRLPAAVSPYFRAMLSWQTTTGAVLIPADLLDEISRPSRLSKSASRDGL
jgi:hypothetical protein